MNWITNFASWYHQIFCILNTTDCMSAIWIVYLPVEVRKSFNLRGSDCKTSLPDQNDKRILWTTDGPLELLQFIQQFKLGISVPTFPNVTDFLTTEISVATWVGSGTGTTATDTGTRFYP